MDWETLAVAGGIFGLRVLGNMITTVRLVLIVRGRRNLSAVLAAVESLIFAVTLGSVVQNLNNAWNLAAYSLGFAVGGYLGMALESRLILRYVAVRVISQHSSHAIAEAVREAGFGATESWGEGAGGQVGSVDIVVVHREVNQVIRVVQEVDPKAFIMLEELRGISQGYFRRLMRIQR